MRMYRNLDNATKQRISQRLKNRSLSDSHKQAISDGMKAYWATIPNISTTENNKSKKEFNDEHTY